jgi:intracellular sulfur oxidation DsrE/DsrF family protein
MKVRTVIHIDENSRWETLLRNVKHLSEAVDMTVSEISVVAHSGEVDLYTSGGSFLQIEGSICQAVTLFLGFIFEADV